jgi:hypothetical protein
MREEMVRCIRSTETGEDASKNVNECSFMKRIVLVPFIGRVLSHNSAFNVLFKLKPFAVITPVNAELTTFQP